MRPLVIFILKIRIILRTHFLLCIVNMFLFLVYQRTIVTTCAGHVNLPDFSSLIITVFVCDPITTGSKRAK